MKIWIIVLIALVIIALALIIFVGPLLKQPDFIKPTGSHKVGTHLFEIKDMNRGGRRLPVHVFYPAKENSSGEFLPAMDNRIAKAFSELYKMPSFGSDEALSNSLIDAESEEGPYPVILFSHGGFSYSTQNLSTFEELASHGYIVFTVSHTNEAVLSVFPDGELIPLDDPSIIRESMKTGKDEISAYVNRLEQLKSSIDKDKKQIVYGELGATFYKDFDILLDLRIGDIHFLLEELNRLDKTDSLPVAGKMDLHKIAMFGHSLGGITTAYICSEDNSPVKGGINLDAPVVTFGKSHLQLQRPFAFFYSSETGLPGAGKIDMTGTNSYYCETSEYECFSRTFAGSAHYNFSDFNFMPPILKYTPLLGSVDPMIMVRDLNEGVLEFFDYLLKDGSKEGSFEGDQ